MTNVTCGLSLSSKPDISTSHVVLEGLQEYLSDRWQQQQQQQHTTTVLRPFVRDYPGEPVPEETLNHPPSWSSSNLYQLLPSTTIHSILSLNYVLGNLLAQPLSVSSLVYLLVWSLHLIFHTFLHPISVFFSQHMPIPSQPVLLYYQYYIIYS